MIDDFSRELLMRFLNATPEQHAGIVRLLMPELSEPAQPPTPLEHPSSPNPVPRYRVGRLSYVPGFAQLWLGDQFYDLSSRPKARLCIQYLFENGAFDRTSARHFEKQIDPYVREHSQLEPLPGYAEIRIHHYFNPTTGRLAQLGRDLIQSAGRGTGSYYLNLR